MKRAAMMVAVTALLFSGIAEATAGMILVTDRGALESTDSVNWGSLGGSGTFLGTAPSYSFTVTSLNGVSLVVQQNGDSEILQEAPGGTWNGNFTPGDYLLYTNGNGPLTITVVASGLSAIGAQIQAATSTEGPPVPFTASITAYDNNGNVIDTFSEDGTSTAKHNNSAIFLGVQSDSNEIYSVTFSVDGNTEFAINQLDFGIRPGGSANAPEPASLALFAVGAAGLLGYSRWQRAIR